MATIIDSLTVQLSLDSKGYEKGTKDARESTKRLRDDLETHGKEIEKSGKGMMDSMSGLKKELIGVLAAFTAGAGVKAFMQAVTQADANLGRMSKTIGISSKELSAWQTVAKMTGGSVEGVTGSLNLLAQEWEKAKFTGVSDTMRAIQNLGVATQDASGQMRPLSDIMLDLSDVLSRMNPTQAMFLGKHIGIDEGTIQMLLRGKTALRDLLTETKKYAPSLDDINAAQKRVAENDFLTQQWSKVGRVLLTTLQPAIDAWFNALSRLGEWATAHSEEIAEVFELIAKAAAAAGGAVLISFAAPFAQVIAMVAALSAAFVAAFKLIKGGFSDWSEWMETGKSEFQDFWNLINDGVGAILSLFTGDTDLIRKLWGDVFRDLGNIWDGFVDKISHFSMSDAMKGLEKLWDEGKDVVLGESPSEKTVSKAVAGAYETRGIRNNNPGNLNYVGQEGATKEGGPNGRFAVFGSPEEGLSALSGQLRRYGSQGINSVAGIIGKFAPPNENNTSAYIDSVSKSLGVSSGAALNLNDPAVMQKLMDAIIRVENGKNPYSAAQMGAASRVGSLSGFNTNPSPAFTGNKSSSVTNTSSAETHIGTINIQTQASDAQGIANSIPQALKTSFNIATQANYGLT